MKSLRAPFLLLLSLSCLPSTQGCRGDSSDDAGKKDSGAQQELTGSILFTPSGQAFNGSLDVTLSSDKGDEIHFTTDGSEPSPSSPLYTKPISLTETTEIRALVFDSSKQIGSAGTAVYLAVEGTIESEIPIIVLDNYKAGPVVEQGRGQTASRPYVGATFMSFLPKGGKTKIPSSVDVATRAAFHVRGQSSARFEKTPYRLELRGNRDEDLDFALLGMPAQSDWVLRGPYADKSLIRDAFFYGLGREIGLEAPRFRLVELYLNTNDGQVNNEDYMGVYLLTETIKNAKERLNLKQLGPDNTSATEITGGYIFKSEWLAGDEPLIACHAASHCWGDLEVHDPVPVQPQQLDWLSQHIHEFHETLYGERWLDAGNGYKNYIDSASFVDQLIVNELGREMDSYVRSAYFHKDRDGVITAGPLWDYNLSFGIGGYFDNQNTKGWQFVQNSSIDPEVVQPRIPGNEWFYRLMQDPAFEDRVQKRWRTLRQGALSDKALEDRITLLTTPLSQAAARNFNRWNVLGTNQIGVGFKTQTSTTWEEQVTFLREWMNARVLWLDSQWG